MITLSLLLAIAPPAVVQPAVTLDPVYREQCRRPCEYVGFSFSDTLAELRQMREHGANAVGIGTMWAPTDDPTAPNGAGLPDLGPFRDSSSLGQTFTAESPFTGVALVTPTFFNEGSGCVLSLHAEPGSESVAAATFTNVQDNQRLWLTFDELPPGAYYVEQSAATGDGIGVWAASTDVYGGGQAFIARKPDAGGDLELFLRTAEGDIEIVPATETHRPLRLGDDVMRQTAEMGISFACSVGNWNNGGFPYYPDWFIERFPDMAMLDQTDQQIMSGMFDELDPWPGIEHPVIVDGTSRHIRAVAEILRGNPGLLYWVMGGEALYPTYLMPSRWTDYAPRAVAHCDAWLRREYESIDALNEAWSATHTSFDAVDPPREPGRDIETLTWFRFRNQAMADRFQWHYAETKGADRSRMVMAANHGNIFHGMAATHLGQDMSLFAGVSDGWEMGQIMADEDSELYNLMWMRAAQSFGKPLCPVRLAYRKSDPKARGGGTSYTPETARRYFWESVGTGAWHMGFIQWRGDLPDGEWGVKGTPAQDEIKQIFEEWHGIEDRFDGMWPVKAKLGLYLAQPTWTLDGFQPVWTELHKQLTRSQIDYRILFDSHLVDGDVDGLAAIISADNRIMTDECHDTLARLRSDGGELLMLGENAIEDGLLRPREENRLGRPRYATVSDLVADVADGVKLIKVTCTSAQPYVETVVAATQRGHDMPYDLGAAESIGQTFEAEPGLLSISVSNPTYNNVLESGTLTMELLRDGDMVASRVYAADLLTDNAWHEIRLDEALPAGTYYLRLRASGDLPPVRLGVWGSREGNGLRIDDAPVEGALELELRYSREVAPNAAIEAFTLSDGRSAMVILTNISGVEIDASVEMLPGLLSAQDYRVTDLASGDDLGRAGGPRMSVEATVPGHRSAVIHFAEEAPPPAAPPKLYVLTKVEDGVLSTAARAAPPNTVKRWEARIVPLPGVRVASTDGAAASIPLGRLGTRYDYEAQEYVPYYGAVQVNVSGIVDGQLVGASRVVEIPR